MDFINYSLKIDNNILIDNLNLSFKKNCINHLLGSNGVGKSCFAKSLVGLLDYSGKIEGNNISDIILISSKSNVPLDLTLKDIAKFLKIKFDKERVKYFFKLLNLENINQDLKIKKMSDGQKQKIKIFCFLISMPKIIILDEFTSALDKKTSIELYKFFNEFIRDNNVMCINITHNLSDIEYMMGDYYLFSNKTITQIDSKEEIIEKYIKGGI